MDTAPAAPRTTSPVALRWQWSRLPGLAARELYAILAARQQVFAVEQSCAFQDADGHDLAAWHLAGWTADGDAPALAAYLRVLDPGTKYDVPSIGRVLTLPPWRGIGLGRVVMREGIERCRARWPGRPIRIAAQKRLEAFYGSLGFRAASEDYVEDGIPHVDMLLAGDRAHGDRLQPTEQGAPMGVMVIALFRPKPGMDEALLACMRDHQPILRREGLVTDRPAYVMRAQDGTLLEVFEWRSQEAIDAAHASPRVAELWRRYEACCDYATLGDLAEAKAMFPGFAPVSL